MKKRWLVIALSAAFALGLSAVAAAQTPPPLAADPTATATAPSTTQASGIYRSYAEAAASHQGMFPSLDYIVTGYALPPYQDSDKAIEKAVEAGRQRGAQSLLLIDQRQTLLNPPPKGYIVSGNYIIVKLASINFVALAPDHVQAELQRILFSEPVVIYPVVADHVSGLLHRCQDPDFASTTDALTALLRDPRADHLPAAIGGDLVDAIAAHPAPDLSDSLVRWATYHRNAGIRMAAMVHLIKTGRRQDVETILAGEHDQHVRDVVSRLLL